MLRLLAREPISTFLVEFKPSDAASLILADGRSIEAWIQGVTNSDGDTHAHFRRMVDDPAPPEGQLIGAAELVDRAAHHFGTVILYDGWHHAAAWVEQSKLGKPSNIAAFLVVTRRGDPFLSPQP